MTSERRLREVSASSNARSAATVLDAMNARRITLAKASSYLDNLKISDKAIICLPYHKLQDIMEEERLADRKYGSTRRGIAPVRGDEPLRRARRSCRPA